MPRSGKTSLAKKLIKRGDFALIDGDAIVQGFLKGFNNSDFNPNQFTSHLKKIEIQYNHFKKFIFEYIQVLKYSKYKNILLESEIMTPVLFTDFRSLFATNEFNVIYSCLGYADDSLDSRLQKYQNNPDYLGWLKNHSNSEIRRLTDNFLKISEQFKIICLESNFQFYDTSSDFLKVISEAEDFIRSQIK